ncbi:MAG: regulatory iron-sulfur-containing complex subunit RicT [Patescibacteria group bacterium]|jgi:cell fate regulator YaaT (PSP1 superfamily)
MIPVAQVKVAFWDRVYECPVGDFKLEIGDQVIVKTDWGTEIGKVVALVNLQEDKAASQNEWSSSIIRKVTTEDLGTWSSLQKQKHEALEYCKKLVDRHGLAMKVIDAHFSFDGGRLIFPFIADGRIDFRVLVKDLTHHFQKSIRLQQIGIRDEAKISGDFGSCGRKLCCKTHLKALESITSDLADVQQISHRGSERLSGLCGRLRCCLAFEGENYQELAKTLPALGSRIKTRQGFGKVIGWHTLKQTVDVALEGDEKNIIEISIPDKGQPPAR